MWPGRQNKPRDPEIDYKGIGRVEAIIRAMTPEERRKPEVINGSRRTRIARGSGTTTTEVNNLLKQFKQVQQMMKTMPGVARKVKGKKAKKGKAGKGPRTPLGGGIPAGFPGIPDL